MNDDNFYRAFEDRFRGTRELISDRLKVYLPFVSPLTAIYPDAAAVDLGCGRGEWLELLGNVGYAAVGIDTDAHMLSACIDLGLNVWHGDALSYLQTLPDSSQVVVSALHVVEHTQFDVLRAWVSQAFRVLKPGGLLILETPNADNMLVASQRFYLDPTHVRPIPKDLLDFVVRNAGFSRVKCLGLQEPETSPESRMVTLKKVFEGVSPDVAVVAQKGPDGPWSAALDAPFSRNYGVTLDEMLTQYADQEAMSVHSQKLQSQLMQDLISGQERLLSELGLIQARQKNDALQHVSLMAKLASYEHDIQSLRGHVRLMESSTSWRLTAPLRWLGGVVRGSAHPSTWLASVIDAVLSSPRLRLAASRLLKPFPAVLMWLKRRKYAHVASLQRNQFPAAGKRSPATVPSFVGELSPEDDPTITVDKALARIRREL